MQKPTIKRLVKVIEDILINEVESILAGPEQCGSPAELKSHLDDLQMLAEWLGNDWNALLYGCGSSDEVRDMRTYLMGVKDATD